MRDVRENEECTDCGGDIEKQRIGDFIDHVCTDCGLIIYHQDLYAEDQEAVTEGEVQEPVFFGDDHDGY